jgi:hypothetical protein
MTQADFTIANQTFPNTRAEINTSIQALATNSAGNSAPSTTFANQWWFDSDDNKLYMRNKDNDAWVEILTIGATSDKVETLTATTINGIPFYQGDTGSIYTHDVSGTDSTAQYNTSYGLTAMDAITTGDQNTSIGYGAGGANQTGAEQVNIGYQAGLACTSSGNVLIGKDAGLSITSGEAAIHIGVRAGDGYDTETNNLSIGVDALGGSVAGGEYNVAIGNFSLDALTSGDNNTAVGYNAGTALNTAASVTLVGSEAGKAITSASSSTFIGKQAGHACDSGTNNIFMGVHAGHDVTSGGSNIAIGNEAYDGCDTESNNLALGRHALGGASLAGAEFNVCVGNDTGKVITSADSNVFVGYKAGTATTTGGYNVFIGGSFAQFCGASNTHGEYNVAIGTDAFGTNITGTSCVAVGFQSLKVSTAGTNTAVGFQSGKDVTTATNTLNLGNGAGNSASPNHTVTGSNKIVLGNNSITAAYIKVDWTVTSDKRDKTDVAPLEMGLDFVNALNPVTFRWDMRSDYDNATPDGTNKKPQLTGGLLAQDVEILEREYGYKVEDNTSIITSISENGNYGLTYAKFVPVLIKAIKELSTQVTTLQQEINILKGE